MEDIRRMEDETQRELEAVGISKAVRQGGRSPDVAGSLLGGREGGSRGPLAHHRALESQRGKWGAITLENYRERTKLTALPSPPPHLGGGRGSLE